MARAGMIPVAVLFAAAALVLAGPVGATRTESARLPVAPRGTSSGGATTPAGLALVEKVLVTTAKEDFGGREAAYQSAVSWQHRRLSQLTGQGRQQAPYLACFEYGDAKKAMDSLGRLLPAAASIRRVSLREQHGACFLVTLESPAQAAALAGELQQDLRQLDPFPSALKIAPGLLDHEGRTYGGGHDHDALHDRLSTEHGARMRGDSVAGIILELSPGVLPAHDAQADTFVFDLKASLMSTPADAQGNNFWSDPAMLDGEDGHRAHPAGALRAREWGRSADVLRALSQSGGTTPGDVCSWGGIQMHHAGDDVLLVTGASRSGQEATKFELDTLVAPLGAWELP
ncbi:unnamed protein product [Scytosiphon promiscuus]